MKLSRIALAVGMAPGLAIAQAASTDAALKLADTVISANRDAQARSESSAASSVFTRADIDRLQPSSVADLLQRVPGVQITRSGGLGSTVGLYIRGTKSAQSLVLIDGQRVGSVSAGGSPLEYLSIEQIERVEVLRGSRSAIYGSDAIGGVIHIITRRASGDGLTPRVRVGYGTHNTWERNVGLSGGNQDTRFSLNASSDETGGINRSFASNAPDNDRDAYRNNAFSASLNHRFNDEIEAGFSVLDQRGESEYDFGWGGQHPYTDYQVSSYSGFLAVQANDIWKTRLELGHSENRSAERFDDQQSSSPFNTYRDTVAWLNTLELGNGHSLILGADGYEDNLHSKTAYDQDSRWNHGLIVQHNFRGERFATELGLRHDKNEQFGSTNTFSGSLTYSINDANDLITSYAEGFRAPTFNDLYWPGGGNPSLKPESSKSYEVQWRSQLAEHTRLETSIYRIDLRDAIAGWPTKNVDQARINGFEANLQQALFGWQTQLGLSLIDPRDRETGQVLNRRAKRTLNLDVDRQFGDFSFGASWLAVSRSYDDADNRREIAGNGVLNLRSAWQATQEVSLGLKVENVFDKAYSRAQYSAGWPAEYNLYREAGRTALMSLTWTPQL
ncbi:MAG: TonB-dependent receptor [Pseudomonadaceae bacterium]|nr:TonB-dependent receptor [Pseudomonadaceae bacterium]